MQGGTAAGYMTIANAGASADVLDSVESSAAKSASLHRSSMNDGMMQMRSMSAGLAVPARGQVALTPGGDHIMLAGLKKALSQGEKIPITLVFQRAGRVNVDLVVDAKGPSSQTAVSRGHP
jgi:copper(I)-binding protein